MWVKRLFGEFGFEYNKVELWCINQAKHVGVKFQLIRDIVSQGVIAVKEVSLGLVSTLIQGGDLWCVYSKSHNGSCIDWNRHCLCAWGRFHNTTNPQAAAQADKLLGASLSQIESLWLKGDGTFLHGAAQPSLADLSLVCELMQLQLVDEKDRERILGPHKKILEWIENTKNATKPHFDEVSEKLHQIKAMLQKQRTSG
ncbi:hypothetical protein UlMin_042333 [Ulmus minor]